jgi:hypothetical protein
LKEDKQMYYHYYYLLVLYCRKYKLLEESRCCIPSITTKLLAFRRSSINGFCMLQPHRICLIYKVAESLFRKGGFRQMKSGGKF